MWELCLESAAPFWGFCIPASVSVSVAEESLSLHLYLCDSNSSSRMWRWWWGRGSSRKDQGPSHTALPFPRTIAQSDDRQSAVILRRPLEDGRGRGSMWHKEMCPQPAPPAPPLSRSLASSLSRSLPLGCTYSQRTLVESGMDGCAWPEEKVCVCASLSRLVSLSLLALSRSLPVG